MAILSRTAQSELWHRGRLHWLLHSAQLEIYRAIQARTSKIFVSNASRRIGKTYLAVIIAIETCLQKDKGRVPFAAPTGDELEELILPIFEEIWRRCPKTLLPKYVASKKKYVFTNGSQIKLSGVDKGHYNRLRGPKADLCIGEEAGFMDCLKALVGDVFMPQLLYSTNGYILLNSTPPESPGHIYTTKYCMEAEQSGNYIVKTIWDNPLLALIEILEFAEEAGCTIDWDGYGRLTKLPTFDSFETYKGVSLVTNLSTTWKREYLAMHVTEEHRAVIPEFAEAEKRIVMEWKRPLEYNTWTVGDLGFKDATAFLFGYYDFDHARIIIEDELILHSPSSSEIARKIREKEKALWKDKPLFQRYADGDLIALQDISKEHGLSIGPVRKDLLEAQVNQLRLDIQQDKLRIHPRCKTTIAHVKYGIWNKQRKAFDRSGEYYHFDALAALIYFVRHVAREANPYPPAYRARHATHYIPADLQQTQQLGEWQKLTRGVR